MKRITIVLVLAGLPLCGCKGGKDYTSETENIETVITTVSESFAECTYSNYNNSF